ncbi:MAG: alpha/beta hydrolase [Planctomycetota bacterium]
MIHGGSWESGDRTEFPDLNPYLAARAYVVAAIDYRLAPAHCFPAPIDDVDRALSFLRARAGEYGIDRDRIVLLGRSAGGQIALTAAYRAASPGIRGVVGFYAPTDMVWSWEHSLDTTFIDGRRVVESYMGGSPDNLPGRYRDASPLALANETSPATLLFHGGRDTLVSPQQSQRLATRLAELGVPHLLVAIPGATHAFDVGFSGPMGQVSTYAIERFLAAVVAP